MAIHDTPEKWAKDEIYRSSVLGIPCSIRLINLDKHRLIIVDNNSCNATKKVISSYYSHLFTNATNIGTAEAVNKGIRERKAGEVVCKADNDVVWNTPNWADELEDAVLSDPTIGILGCKRKRYLAEHVNPCEPDVSDDNGRQTGTVR